MITYKILYILYLYFQKITTHLRPTGPSPCALRGHRSLLFLTQESQSADF